MEGGKGGRTEGGREGGGEGGRKGKEGREGGGGRREGGEEEGGRGGAGREGRNGLSCRLAVHIRQLIHVHVHIHTHTWGKVSPAEGYGTARTSWPSWS